jgi:hypothetical protein
MQHSFDIPFFRVSGQDVCRGVYMGVSKSLNLIFIALFIYSPLGPLGSVASFKRLRPLGGVVRSFGFS